MPIARSPFPSLGECYQLLTTAFDSKSSDAARRKQLSDLAGSEHDWSLFAEIKRDLLIEPLSRLDREFAEELETFIDYLQEHYLELVKDVGLDSLNREQALPTLVQHYAGLTGDFLGRLRQRFGGPELAHLLDPDRAPLDVALCWFEQQTGDSAQPLARRIYPDSKDARDQLGRWRKGTQPAALSSLKSLLKALSNVSRQPLLVANLGRWLVTARALGHFDQAMLGAGYPGFRQQVLHALLLASSLQDGRQALEALNHEAGQRLNILKPGAQWLLEHLAPDRDKSIDSQAQSRQVLDDFIKLQSRYDEDRRTGYFSAWFEGRWQLLSGNYSAALEHYDTALEAALYRAGRFQLCLLQESLALAAMLGKKIRLKQLKHQAVVLGLFTSLGLKQNPVISDWEISQLKQLYARLFPHAGFFPQANPVKQPQTLPILVFDPAATERIKVDLQHPNRVISVYTQDRQKRRYPQLVWFASEGQAEAVSALLQHGADVNLSDEADGSALLCALQRAQKTGERATLDLLLAQPHDPATLNRRTHRKQLTPLMLAIDSGDVELVAQLLEMGASANAPGLYPALTPLYNCLSKLCQLQQPDKTLEIVCKLTRQPDAVIRDVLRRYLGVSAGAFGQQTPLPPEHPLYQIALKTVLDLKRERCTPRQLINIGHLLLRHGGLPNTPHAYPCPGRTPLMLAAEDDELELFKAMLTAGGDPRQRDQDGADCWNIALCHGAHRVLAFLHSAQG
ncbi:hypothetical protein GV819_27215 [Pseudomonas sp. Fl5BN2]|uniref:ankyrin repeat domain-containing protein n=1 Tax=Pseudomonas sp. Fl5BN2 TaxID=2697652 RepID=UPI00137731AB|nr:ankyrin repeat domain-containing protein [Pseudomonas sp. Fl5BN2]NBF05986.1 hypothetical protein [Pseudomonas sp. Fl5BN2]